MLKIWQFIGREITAWSRLAAFVSCLLTIIIAFDQSYIFTDLASHFRLQYMLCGLLGLIVFTITRRQYSLLASLTAVAFNIPFLLPYFSSSSTDDVSSASRRISLALANIKTENTDYRSFTSLLSSESPDVAVILEVNTEWVEQLKQRLDIYPHYKFYPRSDNFGIAILSKYEFTINEGSLTSDFRVPHIDVELLLSEDTPLRVLGIHPLPPVNPGQFRKRNQMIRETAQLVRQSKMPTIVAGDFNTSMWTSIYREFLNDSNLLDPRKGVGIMPTWPAIIGIPLIPIDHIFHSSHFSVKDFRILRVRGSDHRGLFIDLALLD